MTMERIVTIVLGVAAVLFLGSCASTGGDARGLVRNDHFVRVKSTAPAIAGQEAQIYVREVVRADVQSRRTPAAGVVVFVHGAGTPSAVTFESAIESLRRLGRASRRARSASARASP